ncbi:penicillin-binding transpeptidase domain-containing protein [Sulfurimonas sp.]|uniref:penicillin-binding transpeptidase domain-containing protein n=1 Tax=Sulfurimonas sp. TaxID=2022749 RepID=UPI0025EADA37|nr:penicillin-binding transpeptidase domain-containing protein [Sulfurimonas sp.]MDD5157186.1 penicillin-binding transpeptidase domain-containing protein [Sulfurimonas sp.]
MLKFLLFSIIQIALFAVEPNFGKYDGSAVILDLNSSKRVVFGERENERYSPCSTFKILNSLIALEVKAVEDENESIKWDGVVREYEAWNRDHSMRSAIAESTVWFYQEMARRIGYKRMAEYVKGTKYGNMDTSRTLSDFWLGSGSLAISPNEQIDFLSRFVRNDLLFLQQNINTVKDIMTIEKKDGYTIAAKTGSCGGIGWFVGFIENGQSGKVFVFNIKGEGANGAEAKRIALDYFRAKE